MNKVIGQHTVAKTALVTIGELANNTSISMAKELYRELTRTEFPDMFVTGMSWLVESRYRGAEKVIKESGLTQIVELASGFTPHALGDMAKHAKRYIEVDFPENLDLKHRAVSVVAPEATTVYVGGDVLEGSTWEKITANLSEEPVAIFAEGFMQYLSHEQRDALIKQLKKLLKKTGGFYYHEDSLRFHPEFADEPRLKALLDRLNVIAKSGQVNQPISSELITRQWEAHGFKVERLPAFTDLETKEYTAEDRAVLELFRGWKMSLA